MHESEKCSPEKHPLNGCIEGECQWCQDLKKRESQLIKVFIHYFIPNDDSNDKFCGKCGLYLTNEIHCRDKS